MKIFCVSFPPSFEFYSLSFFFSINELSKIFVFFVHNMKEKKNERNESIQNQRARAWSFKFSNLFGSKRVFLVFNVLFIFPIVILEFRLEKRREELRKTKFSTFILLSTSTVTTKHLRVMNVWFGSTLLCSKQILEMYIDTTRLYAIYIMITFSCFYYKLFFVFLSSFDFSNGKRKNRIYWSLKNIKKFSPINPNSL